MKKNWKCWLGTIAAAMLGGSVMAQSPQNPGTGPAFDFEGEATVRMGAPSGSAVALDPAQFTQFEPLDADAVWEEAPRAYRGAPPPEDDSVGFASAASYADVQYRVGRVNGEQYGFEGGYTTLNAFIPLATDSQNLWFFDPRINITDFGEGAASVGLGYRRYSPTMDRIFGVSTWYDYDPGHRGEYSQLGLSFENIGRYYSSRFNANIPLDDSNEFTGAGSFGNPFFQGNNIAFLFNFLREISYQNYQYEVAAPIPFLGRYGAEAGLSTYALVANDDDARDALGIAGRFEFQISEDFWINTVVSHDKIYGTNTSINFELTIPSGPQLRWLRPKKVHDKILASVKRPYRVSTSTSSITETRLFLDPRDGNAIQVAHIDPTAANGAAAGSVTNPFGSVADYMADPARAGFDIVFVGRNVVADDDTDLNTGIELLTGQRLLGTGSLQGGVVDDGTVHQFVALDRGDGQTLFNLPGFGQTTSNGVGTQTTGPNPFLTNSAAPAGTPVVTLNGDITEVSGFTIDASGTVVGVGADGIASAVGRPVDGFVITNNTFQNAINAIDIQSDTSPVLGITTTLPPARSPGENAGFVLSNTIDGTLGTPGGVTNGIVINHFAGMGAESLLLQVRNNLITDVTMDGVNVTATGGTIDGNNAAQGFQSNSIDNSGRGIFAQSLAGATFDLAVQGNTVTNSQDAVGVAPETGAGMAYLANGGLMTFNVVSNNTVTNNGVDGGRGAAFVAAAGGDIVIAPIVMGQPAFFSNTFSTNVDDGLLFSATGAGSTIGLNDLTNNTLTNNGASGVDFMANAGGVIVTGPLNQNTITGNGEDGISGTSDGIGSLLDIAIGDIALMPNTITGNTENGIDLVATNGATVQGSIVNNIIMDNTLNGVMISALEAGSLADFNNAGLGRMISDNMISGNTGAGVVILADNTGPLPGGGAQALLLRNQISGALGNPQQFGIQVLGLRTGDLNIDIGDVDPLNANLITGNSDANISVDLAGMSTADVVIQSNNITNAVDGPNVDFAGDGVVFRTTDMANLFNAQVLNNNITGNASDGIRVLANAQSSINATGDPTMGGLLVQGNLISGNLGDGIQVQRGGNATIRGVIGTAGGVGLDNVLGNVISGNTFHGVNVVTGGDADPTGVSTRLDIGQNLISDNGINPTVGNGVNVVTNDDSQTNVDVISNVIQGLGNQNNGISVTTNSASRFGNALGVSNMFDGNIITGHTGDGVVLTANGISQIDVDIVGDTQQSIIMGNAGSGVSIIDQSGNATLLVDIGNPASNGPGPGADIPPDSPDVIIAQNTIDAIRVAQTGAGDITLNVNNTLASGNRLNGTASRHGLSYNSDAQSTSGSADIEVDNSTFVDFGVDGMNFFYNHNLITPGANTLVVNVANSVIGQTQFSTNVGDGVDIEVRDAGAVFNFDGNLIQNNGGDGFRMVLLAENLTADRPSVAPDRDANNSGQNETTTPNNPGLLARADYVAPWGDTDFIDFTSNLSLTNNFIRFNGLDGVDLAIGGGTRLGTDANRTIVRGNTMTGNALAGFTTRTITNTLVAPPTDSVNNGENTNDLVRLDPLAHLFLAFGDNAMPNITSQLIPTVTGGVYVLPDAIKVNANRAILTNFNVFTNDNNITTIAGNPVSTLGVFAGGWSTNTTVQDAAGGINYTFPINTTGSVNVSP